MVLSQKVDSKVLRMESYLENCEEKKRKIATEIVQILDFFPRRNEF